MCIYNDNSYCSYWRNLGYCRSSNYYYSSMRVHCKATCGFCGGRYRIFLGGGKRGETLDFASVKTQLYRHSFVTKHNITTMTLFTVGGEGRGPGGGGREGTPIIFCHWFSEDGMVDPMCVRTALCLQNEGYCFAVCWRARRRAQSTRRARSANHARWDRVQPVARDSRSPPPT